MRGLKRAIMREVYGQDESHPSRVRGLKQGLRHPLTFQWRVAPLAGAWIETLRSRSRITFGLVAPLAGAWIETVRPLWIKLWAVLSHPSRVRGLKPDSPLFSELVLEVAPLAGAWIETT